MVQGISLETVSLSDLNAKLQVFCDVLVDAAEKSAPCIRQGKKKRLWSDRGLPVGCLLLRYSV